VVGDPWPPTAAKATDGREGDRATLELELLRRLHSFLELRLSCECDLDEVDGDRLDFLVTVSTTANDDSIAFASHSCRRTDGDRLADGAKDRSFQSGFIHHELKA
jgi:hypothetical protein